ncbi:MAG: hypothetical protein FWD68_10425 [Alphaproteobacteria bacterium]|nr:hypothetical protein [Alphaproteobacteria bacterium]
MPTFDGSGAAGSSHLSVQHLPSSMNGDGEDGWILDQEERERMRCCLKNRVSYHRTNPAAALEFLVRVGIVTENGDFPPNSVQDHPERGETASATSVTGLRHGQH